MNLFELFVKIGVDDQASGNIAKITSGLGKGLETAAKIGTAAVGAAASGIAALTMAAVNNYAEYEQLVGGVETLFKTSSDKVIEYAENAYKTAGLSANEYMETVTSFSASLLQSLGGDTEAAAEYADMAITDMSDNANKMGTSMESIQNAYQGFAKQNYTMLDNLKLGYGGTKEEMERLLQDADGLSASFNLQRDESGALVYSYADIVDAIHIVQTEMGITGTTAKEAGKTISGSVGAMKSAWKNLLTGFANGNADIEHLIDNLVTTIVGDGTENNLGVIGNVLPAIETALSGVVKLIKGATPKIIEIFPELVDKIVPSLISSAADIVNSVIAVLPSLLNTVVNALINNAPALIVAATALVQSLIQGIHGNYQNLVNEAIQIVAQLVVGIISMLPQIAKLGFDLIISLANGISENLPGIIPTVVDIINQVIATITENLPLLISSASEIITSLANGIAESIPGLIPTIVELVLQIVDTLSDPNTLSGLVDAAIAIIIALADGLIASFPKLLEKAPEIVQNLVDAVVENAPKFMQCAYEMIGKLIEGIKEYLPKLLESGTEIVFSILEGITQLIGDLIIKGADIVNSVKDGFSQKVEEAKAWGKDLIQNFIDGIMEKWNALKQKVSDVAQSVKDFLGFSEPKKGPLSNFHTYAPDMMQLFAKGIKDNEKIVTDQIAKSFDFGTASVGLTASAMTLPYSSVSGGSIGNGIGAESGGQETNIVIPVILDGKQIGEASYKYIRKKERMVGA